MINPETLDLRSLPWLPLEEKSNFPKSPAIYFAIDSCDNIQYIGRSINPKIRWVNHHKFQDLNLIGNIKIAYLFVDSDLLPQVEQALISWFKPPLNRDCDQIFLNSRISKNGVVCKIRELRIRANMSQKQLAIAVGVTESTVANWEMGRTGLDWFQTVAKLCDYLECTPHDLCESRERSK